MKLSPREKLHIAIGLTLRFTARHSPVKVSVALLNPIIFVRSLVGLWRAAISKIEN